MTKFTENDFLDRPIQELENKFWIKQQRVLVRYFVMFFILSVIIASAIVFIIATNRGWYINQIPNALIIVYIFVYIFIVIMIIALIISSLLLLSISAFCFMSKKVEIKKIVQLKQKGDYFQLIQLIKEKKYKARYTFAYAPYNFIYNHYRFICAALSDFNEKNVEEALFDLSLIDSKIASFAKEALREIGRRKGFDSVQEFIDYIGQRREFYFGKDE